MSKYTPTGNVSTKAQFDAEFEKIKVAIDSQLDRDTSTSNALSVNLDVNSKRILNVPDPVLPTDVVRVKDLSTISDGVSTNVGSLGLVSSIVGVAEQTIFSVAERALFVVQADGYVALQGDIVTASALIAQLQPSDDSEWNVTWFGAVADPTDTTVQDDYFELAALRVQDTGTVVIPTGRFKLTQATSVATQWKLAPEAEIIGLGGVSPTAVTDTTYLTGTMIRLQRSEKNTQMFIGETDYALQKGRTRGTANTLTAVSAGGNGGLLGGSVSSKSDTADQSCIGVTASVYNDNTTTARTVWASYSEAVKAPTAAGNTLAHEVSIVNKATLVPVTPNDALTYGLGVTAGLWVSCGIGEGSDVNASVWGAAVSVGKSFNKGLVFFDGSIEAGASYSEAISLPHNHAFVWYPENGATNDTTPMAWITGVDTNSNGKSQVTIHSEDVNGAVECNYIYTPTQFSPDDLTANLGANGRRWLSTYTQTLMMNGTLWASNTGTPEGSVTAVVGSVYTRTDGGAGTTLYIKETGAGNTGWVAK